MIVGNAGRYARASIDQADFTDDIAARAIGDDPRRGRPPVLFGDGLGIQGGQELPVKGADLLVLRPLGRLRRQGGGVGSQAGRLQNFGKFRMRPQGGVAYEFVENVHDHALGQGRGRPGDDFLYQRRHQLPDLFLRGRRIRVLAGEQLRAQARPVGDGVRAQQGGDIPHHLDEAAADDVHAVGVLVLVAEHGSRRQRDQLRPIAQILLKLVERALGQIAKERHVAQVQLQHALAVGRVHALLEGLVAIGQHRIQDIPEDFEREALAAGHDGSRARRVVQAAHLTQELALIDRRLADFVVNIHRTVDGNVQGPLACCLLGGAK